MGTKERQRLIKRTSLSEYKTQSRGGVGNRAASTRDEDFLEYVVSATAHQYILFFTEKGKCFWLRVFEVPEGSKTAKGRPIQNLINIESDDKIKAYILTHDLKNEEYTSNTFLVMVTQKGTIKKTTLEAYSRPRANGINAINVKEGDTLVSANLTSDNDEIMIATKYGKAIRFPQEKLRPIGRNASGVRGITLGDKDDEVIGMVIISDPENDTILVVSEQGYGKRTHADAYRITNRGGKGVITLNITEKTGNLIAVQKVTDDNDLMIINKSGVAIRMSVEELRVMSRNTQGVKLINLKKNDEIAAITKIEKEEGVDEEEYDENENSIESVSASEIEKNNENSINSDDSENNLDGSEENDNTETQE